MNWSTLPIVVACVVVMLGHPRAETFPPGLVQIGSKIYATNCAICHGPKMENPDTEVGAFDLRFFPHDEHDRFVDSVTNGKNAMPSWGDRLKLADIEALWAFVCADEK